MRSALASTRHHVLLVSLFSAGVNLLYLAPSIFMLEVYDRVLVSGSVMTLLFIGIALLVALATLASLDSIRARILVRLGLRFDRMLAETIMRRGFEGEEGAAGRPPFRGMRDLETLRQSLGSTPTIAVLDVPWIPIYLFVCAVVHPLLGALVCAGTILLFGIALANERASRRALEASARDTPTTFATQEADARAASSARALGMNEALVRKRLNERHSVLARHRDTMAVVSQYSSLSKFARLALQSTALGLGGYLAVKHQISPGAIIAASILTTRALAPVEQIVGSWRPLRQGWMGYRNLKSLLVHEQNAISRTPLPTPRGEVRLESVSLTRPGSRLLALQAVRFAAEPGEIIGIVGPTGAGKSSLARVLAGASAPTSGTIRVDGARYSDWEPTALARHVGYLPQEVDLFAGTIAENISRFAVDAGEDPELVGRDVVAAAQEASAHEMILRLPLAYETELGLGGRGLSPGQAQRIALARALFRDPTILVLDEPNSHLDGEGESALIAALKRAKARGAVAFVVAHRTGFMSVADKLLVLRDGRIDAFGPRDQVASRLAVAAGVQPVAQPSAHDLHSGERS